MKYGISEKRLWIARSTPIEQVPRVLKNDAPSADEVLASLLDESEEMVAAKGGALGLLRVREGYPTYFPFRHGENRLSDVERTGLLPDSPDLF